VKSIASNIQSRLSTESSFYLSLGSAQVVHGWNEQVFCNGSMNSNRQLTSQTASETCDWKKKWRKYASVPFERDFYWCQTIIYLILSV
jgi:hypothetical protein